MPQVVIEPDIAESFDVLLSQYAPAKKYAVVTDSNTFEVAGKQIMQSLPSRDVVAIDLGDAPEANLSYVDKIRDASQPAECIVAVGSGTINDLCKYASYLEGKPYLVYATAASMNGYVSANASITMDGIKRTVPAHAPKAVICDLNVLVNAPKRLTLSGLGDSLCRPTAQTDWLLSHLLLDTHYDDAPYLWLHDFEEPLFEHSEKLADGDHEAIYQLMQTLIISGKGMQHVGGSYPASQGEHMIAHTMEMLHGDTLPKTFHGEEIGVTTLTMARLQEQILAQEQPPLLYNVNAPAQWKAEYRHKIPNEATIEHLNKRLQQGWEEIRERCLAVMQSSKYLHSVLQRAGAPTTAEELGWDDGLYQEAIATAPFTRDRFTFLDIARMSGLIG